MERTFQNPIVPGFNPDPSICRVGEDYYLVTSSFAYFPGLPIYHSRDLVNWQQIGHAMERASQLDLDATGYMSGLWAPTIRHHNGIFYIANGNMKLPRNYIVTATHPAGPWSEPHWLDGADGIDPSLFFDDDGRVWYTGNRYPSEGAWSCQAWIWLQELDLSTMTLVGPRHDVWRGAQSDAHDTEAPHIFKVDGWYYLLVAEGGTFEDHAVAIARSRHITGPYENNQKNPILTHRHLGRQWPVGCVGHADLVQTQHGDWWMVCLGVRFYGGRYSNMGRETFLAPVVWEDGWPVVAPGVGHLELDGGLAPHLPESPWPKPSCCDHFDQDKLDCCWSFIRTPREPWWSLDERCGWLRLRLRPERVQDNVNPSAVVRRQQHINFVAQTKLDFVPVAEGESAGMILIFSRRYHFRFLVTGSCMGRTVVQLIRCDDLVDQLVVEQTVDVSPIELMIQAQGQDIGFSFAVTPGEWIPLAEHQDGRLLTSLRHWGFVGTMVGMYATSNGRPTTNVADFDSFEYTGQS